MTTYEIWERNSHEKMIHEFKAEDVDEALDVYWEWCRDFVEKDEDHCLLLANEDEYLAVYPVKENAMGAHWAKHPTVSFI